jgi:hypothetical protein
MATGDEVVFELKASEKDRFTGGSIALPDGKTLDIGRRLKAKSGGKGRIATSDPVEIDRLDQIEVLQRAKAKSKPSPAKADTDKEGDV